MNRVRRGPRPQGPAQPSFQPCAESAHMHGPTVKRADLFGNVTDTHRTEADLNGWREQQGRLI